jgi:RimJ/RimL family protein N-acetyltransferase
MSSGYPNTLDQFVTGCADRYRNSYEKLVLGIEIISMARLIGLVALTGAEAETGGAELDLYIGEKDCWGKGYGTEAIRLICRYGFDRMRLHRIQL